MLLLNDCPRARNRRPGQTTTPEAVAAANTRARQSRHGQKRFKSKSKRAAVAAVTPAAERRPLKARAVPQPTATAAAMPPRPPSPAKQSTTSSSWQRFQTDDGYNCASYNGASRDDTSCAHHRCVL